MRWNRLNAIAVLCVAVGGALAARAVVDAQVLLQPSNLTIEYQPGWDCIFDVPSPRFSWRLAVPAGNDERCIVQQAYEIEVRSALGDQPVVWNSGVVQSSAQLHIAFAGSQPLRDHWRYLWGVRVWGSRSCDDGFSRHQRDTPVPSAFVNGSFGTAFLLRENSTNDISSSSSRSNGNNNGVASLWTAPWVTSADALDHDRFRSEAYEVPPGLAASQVEFVRAYYIGLGYLRLSVNGRRLQVHTDQPV